MLLSVHIARYRPHTALAATAALKRRERELSATPGVAQALPLLTAKLSPLPLPAFVDLRCQALRCAWTDGERLDDFLRDSPVLRSFERHAHECWHVRLQPVQVLEGNWRGWQPTTEGVEPLAEDEPLFVMTWATIRGRQALPLSPLWRANARAVRHVNKQPGLLASIGLGDSPRRICTFSLWRSLADVKRYAYEDGGHRPLIRPSLDTPWIKDRFFARFRPLASSGSWKGQDPVAQALAGRTSTLA